LSIAQPADVQVGDLLIAAVTIETGITQLGDVSATWTTITGTGQSSNLGVRLYRRTVTTTAATTYSWPTNGKKTSGGIIALRCADPASIVSASAVGANSTKTAPAVNVTSANSMLLTFFGTKVSATHSTPTGMTQRYRTNAVEFRSSANTELRTSTGTTGTRSAGSSTDGWVALSLVIGPTR
jgi:hypothetical protein